MKNILAHRLTIQLRELTPVTKQLRQASNEYWPYQMTHGDIQRTAWNSVVAKRLVNKEFHPNLLVYFYYSKLAKNYLKLWVLRWPQTSLGNNSKHGALYVGMRNLVIKNFSFWTFNIQSFFISKVGTISLHLLCSCHSLFCNMKR